MRLLSTTDSMAPSFLSRAARFAINTISRLLGLAALFLIGYPGTLSGNGDSFPTNYVAGTLIQLNDNGAWSWFMDPRVIVDDGKLIAGSVRAVGKFQSGASDPRWGNVEIAVYDIAAKKTATIVLHPHLEQDDHDAPAFLVRPDGRYMAMYSKHAAERKMYYRISEPHNPLVWGPTRSVETPGADASYAGNNDTYANPFRLPDGRIVNFYRGFHHEPNYMVSRDEGQTWTYGGHWLYGKGGYSPYLKYAEDGKGTIHFVATGDHPRNFDNSLYHGSLRNGAVYQSNGTPVGACIPAKTITRVWAPSIRRIPTAFTFRPTPIQSAALHWSVRRTTADTTNCFAVHASKSPVNGPGLRSRATPPATIFGPSFP